MSFLETLTCIIGVFIAISTAEFTAEDLPKSDKSPFDDLTRNHSRLDLVSQMLVVMELYCRESCFKNFTSEEVVRNSLCAYCYCDDECYKYGDCCPDKYIHENKTRENTLDVGCVSVNLKRPLSPFYYMVTSCSRAEFTDLCSTNITSTLIAANAVTDLKSNISYRNKHCAECHNVFDFKPWTINVNCENYSVFVRAESFLEIFHMGLDDYGCNVDMVPGKSLHPRQCSPYSESMTDTCNVTGKWRQRNEKLIVGCDMFFYPVKKGSYKNIFCYVCNTDKPWIFITEETENEKNIHGFPLTALFDFDDSDIYLSKSEKACPDKQFLDSYNGFCRAVACSVGKVVSGNLCKSIISESSYFRYIIYLDATAKGSFLETRYMEENLETALNEFLNDTAYTLKMSLSLVEIFPVMSECKNTTVTVDYEISVFVFITDASRDELERDLTSVFDPEIRRQYSVRKSTVEFSVRDKIITLNSRHSKTSLMLFCVMTLSTFSSTVRKVITTNIFYADLVVSEMLWCAQVELNSTEYSVDEISRRLTIEITNTSIKETEYYLTERNTTKVCLHNLRDQSVQTTTSVDVQSSISGIVSLICTCISLTFLLVSVLVYIIFPYFRTTSGRNNLALALNLIAAQTLFEFGAEQIQLPITCQVIGFFSHYFWLSSVFWMNACTVNLFYRICFPFHSRGQSDSKIFLVLCLYCSVSPGIIVMVTSLSNYVVLGRSGYGGGVCYLSNAVSRVYGFAVPVGILVVSNILLFLSTMIAICRLPNLSSTSSNKVSFIMCVNLSTITGASWLFGYAYEISGFIGFSYAFSIFLGSVGLFLFMSFFANKLKSGLTCKLPCFSKRVPDLSSFTSTEMLSASKEKTECM